MASNKPSKKPWWVYLLQCGDGSLYTGVTTDVARRFNMHQTGKGARYTRVRGAVAIRFVQRCADQSEALRLEAAMKKLSRAQKCEIACY